MTLAMALVARDGIVVAADGRAVTNDETGMVATQEEALKIIELGGAGALLVAGLAELVIGAKDELLVQLASQPVTLPPVTNTFEDSSTTGLAYRLSKAIRIHYRELFGNHELGLRPTTAGLVAGYNANDETSSGHQPHLLTFNSTTNFVVNAVQEPFALIGTTSLAHYLLRRLYSPELNIERAAMLAFYCLKEACFQNPRLGGQLSIAFIQKGLPLRFLEVGELAKLNETADQLVALQRNFIHLVQDKPHLENAN